MTGYAGLLEKQVLESTSSKQVVLTGKHARLLVMCRQPGEDSGDEVHRQVGQFFRIEHGEAGFVFNET
ncbi:MAG TPA: hypothetical protein PLS53_00715 [Thermoanaerobaculaceae bacterium]|nr:hypothetical protein [Thermoanaerobaculaceae bacterium]HPS76657.1 hypothetical protein [Thermoanaerobaculaceae bacterium]